MKSDGKKNINTIEERKDFHMELVKRTPEEQAKIDADRAKPHCAVVLCVDLLVLTVKQEYAANVIENGMSELKARADVAGMLILSTSISTNVEGGCLCVMILCQWASIEKLEEQQRRAQLTGGAGRRGA